MSEKDRLYKTLNREKCDRAPIICPGGMMSPAVTEILTDIPTNHFDNAAGMAQAARNIHETIGFENFGVPYCMTVEAEEFGAVCDLGSKKTEARVIDYLDVPLEEAVKTWAKMDITPKRSTTVLDAIKILKNDSVPVIGNVTGHISIATSIYEPVDIFKLFHKNPELMHKYLEIINEYLVKYAQDLIKSGVDVIAMSDPTSTGEILGAKNFRNFSVPVYKRFISAMHKENIPVILHICGAAENIIEEMEEAGADALSFDSVVSMSKAKTKTKTPLMGNINTFLLSNGTTEKIKSATEFVMRSGVDIVAPACGIGMETSVSNLQSMIHTAQGVSL